MLSIGYVEHHRKNLHQGRMMHMVVKRAGLYERVSTEEQAKFGFSIKTQIDALDEHCEKNQMKVVDHYTDDGVSGGKAAFRRPERLTLFFSPALTAGSGM